MHNGLLNLFTNLNSNILLIITLNYHQLIKNFRLTLFQVIFALPNLFVILIMFKLNIANLKFILLIINFIESALLILIEV